MSEIVDFNSLKKKPVQKSEDENPESPTSPAEVVELGGHSNMTVQETIELVKRHNPKELLVLYYDEDDIFNLKSSHMGNRDALWLIEKAKQIILDVDFADEDLNGDA